jgi:hypothetical protein
MTTLAEIASDALDAVAGAITDAVQSATVTVTTRTAFDATNGVYSEATAAVTGRAVLSTERPSDIFPDYVVGPGDQLWFLEGFTGVTEGDTLTISGSTYHIKAVQDIMGAGTLFNVIAR